MQTDELKLRYSEASRILAWHKRNIEKRLVREQMTLESLVHALQQPRGITKSHVEAFKDYIKAIVKAEIAGVQ